MTCFLLKRVEALEAMALYHALLEERGLEAKLAVGRAAMTEPRRVQEAEALLETVGSAARTDLEEVKEAEALVLEGKEANVHHST